MIVKRFYARRKAVRSWQIAKYCIFLCRQLKWRLMRTRHRHSQKLFNFITKKNIQKQSVLRRSIFFRKSYRRSVDSVALI